MSEPTGTPRPGDADGSRLGWPAPPAPEGGRLGWPGEAQSGAPGKAD